MNIFLTADHELRSGWKYGAYVAIFLLLSVATAAGVSLIHTWIDFGDTQITILSLNAITLFVPAAAALVLTVRFVDHRPLTAFGVGFVPGWTRKLGAGLATGGVMLASLLAACYAIGYVHIGWTATQVSPWTLGATFVLLLVSAASEELIFRGFPLQILVEGAGKWPAIIGLSGLFGLLHAYNPNASALGTLNTGLAGILLSLAYVNTRSLWFSYGIHIGWNVGLGFVLGFPLSGLDIASLWTTGTAGSDTILGGGYGPEGGLMATFIFGAAAVVMSRKKE